MIYWLIAATVIEALAIVVRMKDASGAEIIFGSLFMWGIIIVPMIWAISKLWTL